MRAILARGGYSGLGWKINFADSTWPPTRMRLGACGFGGGGGGGAAAESTPPMTPPSTPPICPPGTPPGTPPTTPTALGGWLLVLDLGNGLGNDRGRSHNIFGADPMDYSGGRSRRGRRRGRRWRWRRRQEGHQLCLGQGLGVNQRNQHHHADDDDFKNISDGKRGALPVARLGRAINQIDDKSYQIEQKHDNEPNAAVEPVAFTIRQDIAEDQGETCNYHTPQSPTGSQSPSSRLPRPWAV